MKFQKETAFLDTILGHQVLTVNAMYSEMLKKSVSNGTFQTAVDLAANKWIEFECEGRDFLVALSHVWSCSYTAVDNTVTLSFADGMHNEEDLFAAVGALAYAKTYDLLMDKAYVKIIAHHDVHLRPVIKVLKRVKRRYDIDHVAIT